MNKTKTLKISLVTALSMCVFLFATSVFAGGSIFGGHKTSNPTGVNSIGVHICGNLSCPDVILKKGDCGEIENATMKYGVCVCEDGYKVSGNKCVKKEACEETEKVEKTYYLGACCTVPVTDKFCPDEDVPACEKMDEAACAATNETDCNTADGTWVCGKDSPDCICAPTGAKIERYVSVIACKQDETVFCIDNCTCGFNERTADCSGEHCISCPTSRVATCETLECECVVPTCQNFYNGYPTNTGTEPVGTLTDGTQCYCSDLKQGRDSLGRCSNHHTRLGGRRDYKNAISACARYGGEEINHRIPTWEGLMCEETVPDTEGFCDMKNFGSSDTFWIAREAPDGRAWVVSYTGYAYTIPADDSSTAFALCVPDV